MKKFLILLMCLLASMSFSLFANDTYFYMAGGQLVPTKEGQVDIEMKEEVINIVLEKNYYEVTVDFSFYNNGAKKTLEIGFPFFCEGLGGSGTISDFRCWTNDKETSFADYPLEKKWNTNEYTDLENAFVRTIEFPAKKVTKTKITYKSTYGREAPSYSMAKYLYGTGSSWKNAIGKMTIRIKNNLQYRSINGIELPECDSIKIVDENTWEIICTNIEPKKYTDCITVILGDVFGDDGPRIIQKDSFFASRVKLSSKGLLWYTKSQLRLVRNAIYAFHGYPFKSQDLIELFEEEMADYGWYGRDYVDGKWVGKYPLDKNFSENKLSDIEKFNVKLILEEENKR
ncbi:MAG: YARHG domain-containing protein [Treponema sp.]|nr:YARHG domain-containing protein [Treponema sp.]